MSQLSFENVLDAVVKGNCIKNYDEHILLNFLMIYDICWYATPNFQFRKHRNLKIYGNLFNDWFITLRIKISKIVKINREIKIEKERKEKISLNDNWSKNFLLN